MRALFSKRRTLLGIAICLIAGLAGLYSLKTAEAAPAFGDIIITVEDELGNPVSGAVFTFNCDGTDHAVTDGEMGDDDGTPNGTIHVLAATVSGGTSGCVNFDAFTTDTVEIDGYVTEDTTLEDYFALPTESWNTATTTLDFGHKALIVDELGNPLEVDSATAGEGAAATCVVVEDELYCAIPLAADLEGYGFSLYKEGYVQKPGDETPQASVRTDHTDPQVVTTMDVENGMKFAYKLTSITSEVLGADLTSSATAVSVGDASGLNACTASAGDWYCPVVVANSNGDLVARVVHDGYVETSTYQLVTGTTRVNEWDAQVTDTVTTVEYAVKATITGAGSPLSSATVKAGSGFSTTCAQDGVTGEYYCALPLADTTPTVQAVAAGYRAGTADFTDRTAHTNAQVEVLIDLASSGGGGGGGSNGAITTTPAPTAPPTTPQSGRSLDERIRDEANALAASAAAIDLFVTNGTETTLGLGAGERKAALASYREAYGHDPKTAADWTDVLLIANGKWPLTVNKATEARAYINFRAVYGRDANMKNSGDVNALKMMGYGVMYTGERNLGSERLAINLFTSVFGFSPTTTRHWNIVRAMAYSGLTR